MCQIVEHHSDRPWLPLDPIESQTFLIEPGCLSVIALNARKLPKPVQRTRNTAGNSKLTIYGKAFLRQGTCLCAIALIKHLRAEPAGSVSDALFIPQPPIQRQRLLITSHRLTGIAKPFRHPQVNQDPGSAPHISKLVEKRETLLQIIDCLEVITLALRGFSKSTECV